MNNNALFIIAVVIVIAIYLSSSNKESKVIYIPQPQPTPVVIPEPKPVVVEVFPMDGLISPGVTYYGQRSGKIYKIGTIVNSYLKCIVVNRINTDYYAVRVTEPGYTKDIIVIKTSDIIIGKSKQKENSQ